MNQSSSLATLLVLLLASLLPASGDCAASASGHSETGGSSPAASGTAPEWPRPPATARVRFVKSVASAADWGVTRGLLGRLSDSFTGRRDVRFVRPTGVAERAGVLFVADPGAQALFIFDAGRRRVITVARVGDRLLVSPVSVALGPDETVFLVDSVLKQVYSIDGSGKLLRIVVAQGLARPAAVAFDAARGRLYVADSMAHAILVFAPDGRLLTALGSKGREDGRFNSPTHLAMAGDGSLLVTDALNFRVQVFDPDGKFRRKFGEHGDGAGNFAAPKGVAVDRSGHIYVADALFDAIQVFQDDGQLLLGFGEQGAKAGQFWLPNGLFIDDTDILYVADAYNRRIQLFQVLPTPVAKEGPP